MVARKPVAVDPSVDLANSDDPMARMGQGFCPAFNQRVYECAPGILCEQDVPVKMRDGVTIYCDIYRPKDESQKYPAIVSWSWFGKRPGEGMSEWQIMGVPPHTVSKFAKFESPDPMYWCYQGYAVANVDVRGAGHSEGNVHMFTIRTAKTVMTSWNGWVCSTGATAMSAWQGTPVWRCISGGSPPCSRRI